MTQRGISEALKRVCVLCIWIAGLYFLGVTGWLIGVGVCLLSMLVYSFWPAASFPKGTLRYSRFGAVVIPDWIGIIFSSLLFLLPVWAASDYGNRDDIHPMVWLVWPMGVVFLSITLIGWRYACLVYQLTPSSIVIDTGLRSLTIQFSDIEKVIPWHRKVPSWVRRLVPFLVLSGNFVQAGAVMLARDSSGFSLELKRGKSFVVPTDGFEENARVIVAALMKHEVKIGRGLSHLKPSR